MSHDENEKIIKNALDTITTPKCDFRAEVRNQIKDKPHFRLIKKRTNIILVATMITVLSATVLASTIPSFNRLLARISPELALILQPIEGENKGEANIEMENFTDDINQKNTAVVEETGIEIKPLAVINDDDMMMIYLTIQDLTGDRVDETLSVLDYFVEGASINNCQTIDYNPESKTAIVQLTTQGGEKINHTTVQIVIKSLLTGKKVLERVPIAIGLNGVKEGAIVTTTWMSRDDTQGGGGTGDMWNILEEEGQIQILTPNTMAMDIQGMDGMQVSNIGFINGRLHIQTRWEENDRDNHGYFYLVDQDGNEIEVEENNFYFGVDEKNNVQFGSEYVEYILDASKEQLAGMQLMGYFAGYSEVVEGNWELKVDLNSQVEIIKIPCEIQKETWKIQEVTLSPLGVTLRGQGAEQPNTQSIMCSVKLKNGETRTFDSKHTSNQMGEIMIKFETTVPLVISEIESIQIDEDVVTKK